MIRCGGAGHARADGGGGGSWEKRGQFGGFPPTSFLSRMIVLNFYDYCYLHCFRSHYEYISLLYPVMSVHDILILSTYVTTPSTHTKICIH